jgi:hypothetical protein
MPRPQEAKAMKSTSAVLVAFCLLSASFSSAEDPYDFRQSEAYRKLSAADRNRLEQVQRDLMTLWGALDRYADGHDGSLPDTLDALVPRYLLELPSDPFATAQSAKEEAKSDVKSKEGWGYRYGKGSPGNRAWTLSSVGLEKFPYLAASGNYGLYVCKGVWISGRNPAEMRVGVPAKYDVRRPVYSQQVSKNEGPFADVPVPPVRQGQRAVSATQPKRPWGPEQATGAPDTPRAGDIPTAWASLQPNAGAEWLQLGYRSPVEIAEIRIRETYNPGAVSTVVALENKEQVLWERGKSTNSEPAHSVIKPKTRVTSNCLKLYVASARAGSRTDAVELVGTDGTRQQANYVWIGDVNQDTWIAHSMLFSFQRPVEIAEVRIRETIKLKALDAVVALVDEERVLWEGQDPTDSAPADFVVQPKIRVTANRVKIYLQTTRRHGWNEIDAVELIGADGTRQWASSASASSTFAEQPGVSNPYASGPAWATSGPTRRSSVRLEDTQLPYETFLGQPAKVHLEGGQLLEGTFRGSDSQFVTLWQQQGNTTLLVNKARVVYIEIVGASPPGHP